MVSLLEKFCLRWNDFQTNITNSYKDLRDTTDFSDVTLICEDYQKVDTHRVILSACSPFFMKVLKMNKHSHPMIYMRRIKSKDLMAIMDFIYHGEANVFQNDMDSFLAIAEELQLRGLAGEEDKKKQSENFEIGENRTPIKSTQISKPNYYYYLFSKLQFNKSYQITILQINARDQECRHPVCPPTAACPATEGVLCIL